MTSSSEPLATRARSEIRQRQLVMGLRVTEDEAAEIRRRAKRSSLTVSAFLRSAVLGHNGADPTEAGPADLQS